jgi:hypothetical protein
MLGAFTRYDIGGVRHATTMTGCVVAVIRGDVNDVMCFLASHLFTTIISRLVLTCQLCRHRTAVPGRRRRSGHECRVSIRIEIRHVQQLNNHPTDHDDTAAAINRMCIMILHLHGEHLNKCINAFNRSHNHKSL